MLYWPGLNKILFIIFLGLPVFLGAQGYQYSGTRFYFPCENPSYSAMPVDSTRVINIFSEGENCVELSLGNTGLHYNINITGGHSLSIGLDTCFNAYRDNRGYIFDSLNKGYLISSAYPLLVELHAYDEKPDLAESKSESYNIPPVTRFGSDYIFFEQSTDYRKDRYDLPGGEGLYSLFSEDSLKYNIKLTDTTLNFGAGRWYSEPRNAYDVLYDAATGNSKIGDRWDNSRMYSEYGQGFGIFYEGVSLDFHNCFSDFPIQIEWYASEAFVSGYIPDVTKASTHYLLTSIQYGNAPRVRCMSVEDGNRVYVNGVQVARLNKGEVWDTCGYDEAVIESDKPMLLGYNTSNMYRVDSTYSHRPTGAMSYYVPHTGQMVTYTRFKAESFHYADSFFVNLQCRTADTALFVHNGASWKNLGFQPFSHDPSYSYARVNIAAGEHSIKNPNGFIGVHYSMTLNLPFKSGRIDPESRFEDYIYPLGGIAPEDTVIRPYTYSTDGVNFRAFTKDSPVKLCEGKPLYLLATSAHNTQIRWDFDNGDTLVQQVEDKGVDTIVVNFDNAGNYSITTSVLNWPCVKGDTLLVQVENPGVLDFEYQVHQGCDGNILEAWSTSGSYTNYKWLLDGKNVGNENSLEYSLKPDDTEVELTLIAKSNYCSDSVAHQVLVSANNGELIIPNVFTPNGDGINDCFSIDGLQGYKSCYDLSIFNRWGKKVFTGTDPTDCWGGGDVAPGTYYYVLRIGKDEYKGNLFLNR